MAKKKHQVYKPRKRARSFIGDPYPCGFDLPMIMKPQPLEVAITKAPAFNTYKVTIKDKTNVFDPEEDIGG